MAQTPSRMLPLGTSAPEFSLPDVTTGQPVTLSQLAAGRRATLVMFICNHCPYVVHVRDELARLARDYASAPLAIAGISSNDVVNYPSDSPEHLRKMAAEAGFTFPVLYDESQAVARAYDAACTPDFYLFDRALHLAYRGQLDDSRPGRGTPDGQDLRAAIDAVLAGQPVSTQQKPSTGCGIKWKR